LKLRAIVVITLFRHRIIQANEESGATTVTTTSLRLLEGKKQTLTYRRGPLSYQGMPLRLDLDSALDDRVCPAVVVTFRCDMEERHRTANGGYDGDRTAPQLWGGGSIVREHCQQASTLSSPSPYHHIQSHFIKLHGDDVYSNTHYGMCFRLQRDETSSASHPVMLGRLVIDALERQPGSPLAGWVEGWSIALQWCVLSLRLRCTRYEEHAKQRQSISTAPTTQQSTS
jgi:hypothetical protein